MTSSEVTLQQNGQRSVSFLKGADVATFPHISFFSRLLAVPNEPTIGKNELQVAEIMVCESTEPSCMVTCTLVSKIQEKAVKMRHMQDAILHYSLPRLNPCLALETKTPLCLLQHLGHYLQRFILTILSSKDRPISLGIWEVLDWNHENVNFIKFPE